MNGKEKDEREKLFANAPGTSPRRYGKAGITPASFLLYLILAFVITKIENS